MDTIINFFKSEENEKLLASMLAILLGLFVGFFVLLISKPSVSFSAIMTILRGGFQHGLRGVGNVVFRATPIILTGLSVAFAFKTGLFNIGVTGQFTVGAFTAIYVGVKAAFIPSSISWIIALLAGSLSGMVWGFIVGFLKAHRNVNEVIASIMMNYIGMHLVRFLIVKTVYNDVHSRTLSPQYAYLPQIGLNRVFPGSSLNIGFIIAIFVSVLIYILLEKTKFGYELKAVGYNRYASRYAGIDEKKSIIYSMMIAGALAGLGGGLMYLSDVGRYITTSSVLLPEGFDGISVALLAQSNPIAVIFSGLFISHLTYGGNNLQIYKIEPEIIQVITSTIIYVSAFSLILRNYLAKFLHPNKSEVKFDE